VLVSGDDAVAAAYAARMPSLGAGLGFNLRSASYAGLSPETMAALGDSMRRLALELRARLVPLPIALDAAASDGAAIRQVLGDAVPAEPDPSDTADAIRRTAHCRVVVTASYHAAVFALAQGIPAVGLARTAYYADKFEGLVDLFGPGARVVRVDAPEWQARLDRDARDLWSQAAERRAGLLAQAADQMRKQEDAYARLHALVAGRADAGRARAEASA
jgi:colanic acid/amylovoran biosynthesis protein